MSELTGDKWRCRLQRRIIIWTIYTAPANLSLELESRFEKIFTITCASVMHLIWKCKKTFLAWRSVNQKSETWFSGSKFEILEWKHFRPGLKCSQTDPTLGTQNNASLSRLIRHLRVSLGAKKFCIVFFGRDWRKLHPRHRIHFLAFEMWN